VQTEIVTADSDGVVGTYHVSMALSAEVAGPVAREDNYAVGPSLNDALTKPPLAHDIVDRRLDGPIDGDCLADRFRRRRATAEEWHVVHNRRTASSEFGLRHLVERRETRILATKNNDWAPISLRLRQR